MSSGEEVTTKVEWRLRGCHAPANDKKAQKEDGQEPNNGMWILREDSHEQANEKDLKRIQTCWQIELNFQSLKSWENKPLLTSPYLKASVMVAQEN